MDDINTYSVYQHIFPDGMIYTGLTHLEPVIKRYGKDGKRYKGNKTLWGKICKYGWDNIKHVIIKNNLSKEEAQQLEKDLIKETRKNGQCVNVLKGGDIGGASYLMYEYNGQKMSLREIYEKYHTGKVSRRQFYTRVLSLNWDIDRALSQDNNKKKQPFGVGERHFLYEGKMLNSYELWKRRKCKELTSYIIAQRINQKNWSIEDAISKPMKKYGAIYNYKGKEYTIKELANLYPENNLECHDITDRLRNGWTVDKAVETPKAKKKLYNFNNKMMSLIEIYRTFEEPKVSYSTFYGNVKNGKSFYDAVKYNK